MEDALRARLRATVLQAPLFAPRARLLVGVSGGPDSTALLHLLVSLRPAWKLVLHVAHLDHALRRDSAEDAAWVRDLAERWKVPVTVERREVSAVCAQRGWSLEDGGRRIRYEFFLETAKRQSAQAIVLAHTADDQAETVLMRLLRGAGLLGLSGIPVARPLGEADDNGAAVRIVRPLLEVWRREIIAYLRRHHLTAREDPTNAETRWMRNRIRHRLLPLLEREYNPQMKTVLVRLAEQCADDAAYVQGAARRQWRRTTRLQRSADGSGSVAVAVEAFLRQPKALQRQLLRQTIQHLRGDLRTFEFRHWVEAERLFLDRPQGTILDLPGGIQLRRERDQVICHRRPIAPTP